ncbi:uncharacterized protein MELLADRAFT_88812 [Melampsora larici-populina 98AG31]|uniref:Uncharacterized protein n=1 Tax=Melampsora larici-populina (strain 98AG31 / pathotype 3-4-7) TaxID=747676 RepID=F4RT24_MELLP|nr:uncharacterized protein MELLADRAFT_88812 [Melampsora larici-populina 98AG31]EGG04505.1 hypothetical protein MELLADRAFT_88812 [Melampsora larici-populina 98AG31]
MSSQALPTPTNRNIIPPPNRGGFSPRELLFFRQMMHRRGKSLPQHLREPTRSSITPPAPLPSMPNPINSLGRLRKVPVSVPLVQKSTPLKARSKKSIPLFTKFGKPKLSRTASGKHSYRPTIKGRIVLVTDPSDLPKPIPSASRVPLTKVKVVKVEQKSKTREGTDAASTTVTSTAVTSNDATSTAVVSTAVPSADVTLNDIFSSDAALTDALAHQISTSWVQEAYDMVFGP